MEKEENEKKTTSALCKCGCSALKKISKESPVSPICLNVAISIEICHVDSEGKHQLSKMEFVQ